VAAAQGSKSSAAARNGLRRVVRAAEQPVLRAFLALVEGQHRRGALTPAVEATIAKSLKLADLGAGGPASAPRPLVKAVRDASRSLDLKPDVDGQAPTLSRRGERHLARLLEQLKVTENRRARLKSPAVRELIDAFHRLWYDDRGTWRATKWQGVTTWKCPLDLWLYQEMIHALRPGLIIETGTAYGGSATYMGWLCDIIDNGRIVSVDIAPKTDELPRHPRVTYLRGSSTDPSIVEQVRDMITPGEPVMVILDSDHSEAHVRNELLAYADLVTPGSYLIVEDTNVNGHPAHPRHGPGPMEALNWFLSQRSDFTIDESKHRYHLTLNPRGYLKRTAAS
jgi:cephalosporin hydroxylase